MKHNPTKANFRPASLRQPGSARTVLLRMAADQERADRIRALKLERPDLTWRRIADYVGVSERAASDWQKKGGIEYDNAKKLAALFEVDVDYVWRGSPQQAPDLFPAPAIERELAAVLADIKAQLAEQTRVLDEIKAHAAAAERMLAEQRRVKGETEAATQRLLGAADVATRALQAGTQPPAAAPERRAK